MCYHFRFNANDLRLILNAYCHGFVILLQHIDWFDSGRNPLFLFRAISC